MNKSHFTLMNLFAATTYAPFVDKILALKDEDQDLRESYKIALSGIGGMYEFKEGSNIKEIESGKLSFDFNNDDPNFFKLGPERLEIQQILDDEITEEKFIQRFIKLNEIHSKIFDNKPIKFGLVKIYNSNQPINLEKYFNINNEYKKQIDNCKNFVLLKRDSFNINIEYTYVNNKFNLRIDINDIINRKNIFEISHFDEIVKYHTKVFENEIDKIFGGING